ERRGAGRGRESGRRVEQAVVEERPRRAVPVEAERRPRREEVAREEGPPEPLGALEGGQRVVVEGPAAPREHDRRREERARDDPRREGGLDRPPAGAAPRPARRWLDREGRGGRGRSLAVGQARRRRLLLLAALDHR